jgi:hypothetical protein
MSGSREDEGGEAMTKVRLFSVLLIAALGVYILMAGAVLAPLGMSDGGGF